MQQSAADRLPPTAGWKRQQSATDRPLPTAGWRRQQSATDRPPPTAGWKRRLQSFQKSFRSSFRSKNRRSNNGSKEESKVQDEREQKWENNDKIKSVQNPGSCRDIEDNVDPLRREREVEPKHTNLSEFNKKQDHYKPMSTSKVHSMHGKTFTDGRNKNERKHVRRKCHSNNSLADIERRHVHDGGITSHCDLTSEDERTSKTSPKHEGRPKKTKSTLFRPKSLNTLSSLFNRSSSSRTGSKTNRGKIAETSPHLNAKQSTSGATKDVSRQKNDLSTTFSSSTDSLDDCLDTDGSDLSNVIDKRYYSLKRSRASLVFPPTSERNQLRGRLREKSRTFCGVQEGVTLESSSHLGESADFEGSTGNKLERSREKKRDSGIRKRRAVSLLVPLPSSTLEQVQKQPLSNDNNPQSSIGTNCAHLRYNGTSLTNIRRITRHLSMSKFCNIPSLGVTYVNCDGVEKTLVILSGNATQSCFELIKDNERVRLPLSFHCGPEKGKEILKMGNTQGSQLERSASYGDILNPGGRLRPSSSTPDLFSRRTSAYTISRVHEDKKRTMGSMLKGLSLRRHSLATKNQEPAKKGKKNRKRFGFGARRESQEERDLNSHLGVRLAGCSKSLSRSMDCLTDLKIHKIPPIHRTSLDLYDNRESSAEMNGYESVIPKNSAFLNNHLDPRLENFLSESDGDDSSLDSNDSSLDFPPTRTIIVRRGSQPNVSVNATAAELPPNSLPSKHENDDVFRKAQKKLNFPLYNSTPIERMSTLERQRSKSAVSEDPEVPPPVRPRIQSLEELSPVTHEVILRKKKSLASRRTRLLHSFSVPNEEYIMNSDVIGNSKRYSLGSEMGDFMDGPVPLTAFKSVNTELLDSQDSFATSEIGSLNSLVAEHHLTPPTLYKSSLRVSMEDLSKSPTIHEECEKHEIEKTPMDSMESNKGNKRSSLSRNPRLGMSTGDLLTFEPGGTLKRREESDRDEAVFEIMDVPEAFAEALWDHVTMDPEELSFKAGDIITVISMTNIDWWFGQVGEAMGWFPAPFVRVRVSQTLDELENHLAPPVRTRRFTNEGILTKDDVRTRVVNEILETEKSYVKNLKDVVEGYLRQAQKREEMFSEEEIYLLFSNIEEIYIFHQKLLAQMKKCYVKGDPCATQIGAVFIENKQGFNIYSEYCNNHPQAIAEFKILNEKAKYKHFFEACRLLQDMINISLDGFLLTPVQKICKYPLQLAELLKHTHTTHKDYEPVRHALESMKNVAALINERKRKVENISKIAKWQSTIEGWEGENVLERSSELIHSGEVYKVFNGTTQERVCFLFDHQLIYCKKDILRKNGLSYKGRIDMDLAQVEWLEDGEEIHKNEPLNNAWRIYNAADSKWYVVFTKKPADKEKWREAFEKEKKKVNEEAKSGLAISQSTRRAVMRSTSSSLKGRKAAEKREKFLARSSSQSDFLKAPPSPILRLPPAVSSADYIKEDDSIDHKESILSFIQRTTVLRRSFGLRGSKRSNKDKRASSVF